MCSIIMTTMSRQCGKNLLKSYNSFCVVKDMVARAVDAVKPSLVKSLSRNRDKLDENFIDLCLSYKNYKEDTIFTDKITEERFNEDDEHGTAKFTYNDQWMEDTKVEYYDLIDKSDEVLEGQNNVVDTEEKKVFTEAVEVKQRQEKRAADSLSSQVENFTKNTTATIDKLTSEVRGMEDGCEGVAKVNSLKSDLHTISDKLDNYFNSLVNQYILLLGETEAKEKELLRQTYINEIKSRIDNLLVTLSKKVKDVSRSSVGSAPSTDRKDHTFLKKTEPPKWNGDPVDFADFVRKWKSQVSPANLPAQAELDRLRENVPAQASKALFGESEMSKAWKILENLYGDKDLIANILKQQLKNVKVKGKFEYETVIELATDVNNIVLRLKAVDREEMLHVDSEFLSAVFRAMPVNTQVQWLQFDKTLHKSKWAALIKFLDIARDQAVQTKVLMAGYEQKELVNGCRKCGGSGHKARDCPSNGQNRGSVNSFSANTASDDGQKKEREKKAEKDCGKCPLCKNRHTFYSNREKEKWPSDRLYRCEDFRKQTEKERASTLEKFGACPMCTSWNHKRSGCKTESRCRNVVNNNTCGGQHSSYVCGSGNAYCGSVRYTALSSSNSSSENSSSSSVSSDSDQFLDDQPDLTAETLLLFQEVNIKDADPAFTCWDVGSTRCLVTHSYAAAHTLRSKNIIYRLDVVGSKGEPEDGCYYEFEMVYNDGSVRKVWGYGIDKIMEDPDPIDLSPLRKLFPHLPSQVFSPHTKRPVDILMGNNFLGLHPSGGQGRDSVGDVRAYESSFGCGWVLGGTHPSIAPASSILHTSAVNLARTYKCEISPELLPSFWEGDCLGVLPPKRCGRCLRCSQCTDPALIHSRKDQDELEMLEKGVKLVNGQIQVSYPFIRDPNCLPYNRNVVLRIAEKLEKRLLSTDMHTNYNQEFQKYIDRGGVVKLTKQEIEEYKGPVNYISHHGVIQDSVTTPLRIVTNSSLKNGTYSLNECLARGPNSLNSMLDISLRFRCHEEGMVFDLTKAYNSLKTGLVEKHLRRFVWRFDPSEEWADYAFDCVAFGDIPAANCLTIGMNLTAKEGEHIDPVASKKIVKDSYVDDNVTGGTAAEVKRMKGERLPDGTYTGTMTKIVGLGKLKIKVIVSTGESDESVKHLINNKVLGYAWNATTDDMGVVFTVFLTNKRRKVRTQPAITKDTLGLLDTTAFTKRVCLGITNGFLDFMGISCPFTIRFKLLMRQLHEGSNRQLNYDDKVPDDKLDAWKTLIAEAVQSSSLCFPRSVRPPGAIGLPLVVSFGDGAFPAFSANVYTQWQVECSHGKEECDLDYDANLLWAKARVTPLNGYTVPRSELSGTVLECRMTKTTVKALQSEDYMKPKGVIMLSDSECSISALDTTTRALKPFFHNRVSEILEDMNEMRKYCPVEDLHHVSSEDNPADLATRGFAKIGDLGPGSFWQKGPSFLCSRRALWPVTRDFMRKEIPDVEVRGKPAFLACMRAGVMSSTLMCDSEQSSTTEPQPLPELWKSIHRVSVMSCKADSITVMLSKADSKSLPELWLSVQRVIHYSNNLMKVTRILARVLYGWKLKSMGTKVTADNVEEYSVLDLHAADRLILLSAMPETATAEDEGKLISLSPKKDGCIIVSCGRIGEENLSKLLGTPHLPILMPQSRAAYMLQSHEGVDGTVHCSIVETLARSREKVWVVRGRDVAKKVCSQCYLCRRRNKKLVGQKMAQIKDESVTICRPWTFVSLDFAGPVKVKGAVNARARMKCWITVYVCRSTKAVELLATCGYSTADFLLRHEEFVARHAAPATIVSDRGSQLVSAGRVLAEKAEVADKNAPGQWDWSRITRENKASNWIFVPIGSPHFNGLPEATVKVLKKSLSMALHPGVVLSYPELVTLLAKISYTVNSRPLGLGSVSPSSLQEDHIRPITPNMMLLSRSSNISPPLDYSDEEKFCARLAYVSQVEKEWWDRWIRQVLPTLFSYKRWKFKQENVVVGDLVMLKYPGQFKDDYCVAKVTRAVPDQDGLVRKVTVDFKKRNPRESPTIYKSKPLLSEEVAVHRLHKLHLADEPALLGDHGVVLDAGEDDDYEAGGGQDVGAESALGDHVGAVDGCVHDQPAPNDVQGGVGQGVQAQSE